MSGTLSGVPARPEAVLSHGGNGMTATNTIAPRAFAVWWKDLERWVIPTSFILRQSLPPGWTRAIVGTLVRQRQQADQSRAGQEYKMAGVRLYGEGVFHRETVRGDAMSASQVTPLVAGALIYNRLSPGKRPSLLFRPNLRIVTSRTNFRNLSRIRLASSPSICISSALVKQRFVP